MNTQKSPRWCGGEKLGTTNRSAHDTIAALPFATAECEVCGGHFFRKRADIWKVRCFRCWRWRRVGRNLEENMRLLRVLL